MSLSQTDEVKESSVVGDLHNVLSRLSVIQFPVIASPEHLRKRASVALIIRISPSYSTWPPQGLGASQDLESFFAQPWVQQGQPEVLFIKRAARKGDRWTSHVAFPGGKRDPEDADDLAAAIREAWEEVGIDLSPSNPYVLQTGNLPQRVITTQWGKVPLMVLCPYIFLVTRHGIPPLRLQPSEVASCHWVPLAELLDTTNNTTHREDVTNRFANQETGIKKWIAGAMIGQMVFSAVHLKPSETIRCKESPAEGLPPLPIRKYMLHRLGLETYTPPVEPPLLLWGLTLGVLNDFLDLLPPHEALSSWAYPTFTPWDIRFFIWAMAYRFKARKAKEVQLLRDYRLPAEATEVGLDAVTLPSQERLREAGISGLSTGLDSTDERTRLKAGAVSTMLEGYYDIVRKAVTVALVCRTGATVGIVYWAATRGHWQVTINR